MHTMNKSETTILVAIVVVAGHVENALSSIGNVADKTDRYVTEKRIRRIRTSIRSQTHIHKLLTYTYGTSISAASKFI